MKLTTGRLGRPIPAAPPATLALLLALWSPAWAAAPDYDTVMALNEGRLYAEAFRALAQIESAANADPRLLRLLGDAYAEGHGVTENPATALALYQRAVSAGDAVAAVRLGAMYERGAGVPQSPRQAFDWYVKVADRFVSPPHSPRDIPRRKHPRRDLAPQPVERRLRLRGLLRRQHPGRRRFVKFVLV